MSNRLQPVCIQCLHRHDTALTCQQAKEAEAARVRAANTVKICAGYCEACEADHSGFTCHDFQTMKAKALREQAAHASTTAARPQDGSKVAGYRKLSDAEIEQMNTFKAASRNFVDEIDQYRNSVIAERTGAAMLSTQQAEQLDQALRWLAIARTEVQKACMAACRAVARPADDC